MIYLSNFLEELHEQLCRSLYQEGDSPFTRRLLIFPDLGIKADWMQCLADDSRFQICAGIECTTLAALLGLPSSLELSLFLECQMRALIEQGRADFLQEYTEGHPKRIGQLCDHLSRLFLKRRSGIEARWQGWKQTLWEAAWARWPLPPKSDKRLYLFGFTFLPSPLLDHFEQRGARFYFLSPCRAFWSDYYSDKQRLKMGLLTSEEREHFDHNVFLSAWGRVGRAQQDCLLEKEVVECFCEQEGEGYLHRLQRSLLDGEKEPAARADESFSLYSAPTIWDEVLLLKQEVLLLIQKGALPEEIQVFTPNLSRYFPYVTALFQTDPSIDCLIEGLPEIQLDPVLQAFEKCVYLMEHPEATDEFIDFLCFPAVTSRFEWSESGLRRLAEWCREERKGQWKNYLDEKVKGIADGSCLFDQDDLELFSHFYQIVRALWIDHSLQPRTLSAWMKCFHHWFEQFLDWEEEPACLAVFRELARSFQDEEREIPFESAKRVLKSLLNRRTGCLHPGHLQAVRFSPLPEETCFPRKYLFLIGMEEEVFPRFQDESSLGEAQGCYLPTLADRDRATLLQLILSARSSLRISYPRLIPGQTEERGPAAALELFSLPFEQKQYSGFWKKKAPLPLKAEMPPPFLVELRKLSKLAKDPRRFFLQEGLSYYEENQWEEEEFALSPLSRYLFCKEALKSSLEDVWQRADKNGLLPPAPFKEAGWKRLCQEWESQQQHFQNWGVSAADIFSIHLSPTCKAPCRLPTGDWIFPPLEMEWSAGKKIRIQGSLEEITPQGLLVRSEGTISDLIKVVPHYLVYRLLMPSHPQQILCLKKGKQKKVEIENPMEIGIHFLNYYARALQEPSPLEPECVEDLFSGKPVDLPSDWIEQANKLFGFLHGHS